MLSRNFLKLLREVKQASSRVNCKKNVFLHTSTWAVYIWQMASLLQEINVPSSQRRSINILEWGCGVGFHGELLRELGFEVVSCDIPDSLSTGQEFIIDEKEIVFLNHPYNLPFDDDEFHVVLSFGVLEHVPYEIDSINEIHRVLKVEGIFFITLLPAKLSYINQIAHLRGDWYHDRLYDFGTINKLLNSENFRIDKVVRAQVLPRSKLGRDMFWEYLDRILAFVFGKISTNFEVILRKRGPF